MVVTGSTPPTSDRANYGHEHMFVSPADLGRTKYIDSTGKMLSKRGLAKSRLVPAGSTLFVCIGSTIGKVGVAGADLATNQQINSIVPNEGIDAEYLYYAATTLSSVVREKAGEQAVPLVNKSEFSTFEILVPPIAEQRSIAARLAEADDLAASLERLIAKKRDIKQGMMQELLTGRTRLPGFTGEWTTRRIGDFAHVKAGGTPSTLVARYWGGDIRWMSSGEVHQKRVREVVGRITTDGLRESAAQLLPVGTVLMALAGQGKTRGTVAVSRVELSTNQSIAGILPGPHHDSDFLYYNLDTRYEELRGESSGDGGRGGLNLRIIKSLDVYMPGVPEQAVIAEMLSEVDNELDTLGQRVRKARAVKQGMMHELLTGRTRLPVEGVAA